MIVQTLITTAGVVIVAYIGYRQEIVRRELKRFNGSVDKKLESIHQNLVDNPGPPTRPPNEYVRPGGTSDGDPTLTPNDGGA